MYIIVHMIRFSTVSSSYHRYSHENDSDLYYLRLYVNSGGTVKGVSNYMDSRKSGRNPRAEVIFFRRIKKQLGTLCE